MNLAQNYEISPYHLETLQNKVIDQINLIVNKNWASIMPWCSRGTQKEDRKVPTTVDIIAQTLNNPAFDSPYKKLKAIQSICQQKQLGFFSKGIISRYVSWRSKETEEFYSILKNLSRHPS